MKLLILFLALNLIMMAFAFGEVATVKIGGYNFPPFVEEDGRRGIVMDLIHKLNSTQKKYRFNFVLTSANRRYKDFQYRKFDMILFEDEAWGWKEKIASFNSSSPMAHGSELVIALKQDRDQSYFDSFAGKKIKVVLGFHYKIINMDTNQDSLDKSNLDYGITNQENLKELLAGKIDITFINSFYLEKLFEQDKDLKSKLLISSKSDQYYSLRAIVHPKSPISVKELEKLGLNSAFKK
jgi:ABC-type amino acid transport substrate-binding protein